MQRKGSLKTHGNRPGRRTAKPVRHNGGTSTDNPSNRNVPDAEERRHNGGAASVDAAPPLHPPPGGLFRGALALRLVKQDFPHTH